MKYSIIIPTFNHLDDCLKPCVESIIKYTDLKDEIEVNIVANGCTDNTVGWIQDQGRPFNIIEILNPIGFPKAANHGINASCGDYLILLNNDTILLEQKKNTWLKMLEEPFRKDDSVGITGPLMSFCPYANHNFLIFFCVMIKRELIKTVGKLDEIFTPGAGEDTSYCIEAIRKGYRIVQVPDEKIKGGFPIYHKAEVTMKDNPEWDKIFKRNSKVLMEKYNEQYSLSNNFERAVIGKNDFIPPRETTRYKYVVNHMVGDSVLDIGCSSGYGTRFFSKDMTYLGLDYDPKIIEFAKSNFEDNNHKFINIDINSYNLGRWDTIIALEVIEHLKNGKELAQKLKIHCKKLIITVPYNETPGLWGQHHVLHNLKEEDFPGFSYTFISEDGRLIDEPENYEGKNLMIMEWPERQRILCLIPTKNRYFSTLPLTISSVCNQTVKPDKLLIIDDTPKEDVVDITKESLYTYLFKTIEAEGMKWEWLYGLRKGQHHSHQYANMQGYDLVWRLDDDNVAKSDVLEKLLFRMGDDIGAVAGSVISPDAKEGKGSNLIKDINDLPNNQWSRGTDILEAEHLYSSFLYRPGVTDYPLNLSPVAHREETIFTYRLFQLGYKLIVDRNIITYHYRNPQGGIRDNTDEGMFEHDEMIFLEEIKKQGYKLIVLNNGLGDHLAFLNVLPDILKKYKFLTIACCYPEVFEDYPVKIISINPKTNKQGINIYGWMRHNNWKGSIVDAYAKVYCN